MEKNSVLDRLEYSWGMPRGTLNVHTRYNICILGAKLHHLFDHKGLLFLPTQNIIEQYLEHTTNTKLPYTANDPDAETRTFEYHMCVPPYMKTVGIFRRKVDGSEGTNAEDFEVHPFPYNTLPIIKSHLLPQYVIYNAGKKIAALQHNRAPYHAFLKTNAHIVELPLMALKIELIYSRWTHNVPLPKNWKQQGPPSRRPPPTDSSSRAPTEPRRNTKRKAEGQGSPTPSRSKRAKEDIGQGKQQQQGKGQQSQDNLDGPTLLDAHSVKKLDRRSDRQVYGEKRVSIDKWRASIGMGLEAETPDEGVIMEGMC